MKDLGIKKILVFMLFAFLFVQISYSQEVNMDRYIILKVVTNAEPKLYFKADVDGTPVKIVSGEKEQLLTVDDFWYDILFQADGDTIIIYGNVRDFMCYNNHNKIDVVDLTHNAQLEIIFAENNNLAEIKFAENSELKHLSCFTNILTELDLSTCPKLEALNCGKNYLTSLDLSANNRLTGVNCQQNNLDTIIMGVCKELKGFDCQHNNLTGLDLSTTNKLAVLMCSYNKISNLDLTNCAKLEEVSCHHNQFTTTSFNELYCTLPPRDIESILRPLYNDQDPDKAIVMATNAENANAKNWFVQYYYNDMNIPTNGQYSCTGNSENIALNDVTIFPNPVENILNISTSSLEEFEVQIFDATGALVLTTKNSKEISVAELAKGIYTLKISTNDGFYSRNFVKH